MPDQYTAVRYSLDRTSLEIVAKNKKGELFINESGAISIDIDEAANIDEDFIDDVVFFSNRQSTNRFNINWMPYDADCFADPMNWIEVNTEVEPIMKTINRGKKLIQKNKQLLNERAA